MATCVALGTQVEEARRDICCPADVSCFGEVVQLLEKVETTSKAAAQKEEARVATAGCPFLGCLCGV